MYLKDTQKPVSLTLQNMPLTNDLAPNGISSGAESIGRVSVVTIRIS